MSAKRVSEILVPVLIEGSDEVVELEVEVPYGDLADWVEGYSSWSLLDDSSKLAEFMQAEPSYLRAEAGGREFEIVGQLSIVSWGIWRQ